MLLVMPSAMRVSEIHRRSRVLCEMRTSLASWLAMSLATSSCASPEPRLSCKQRLGGGERVHHAHTFSEATQAARYVGHDAEGLAFGERLALHDGHARLRGMRQESRQHFATQARLTECPARPKW